MKKILLVAMAAAAMVGCSQNEEIENAGQKAEMKFETVVSTTTRASVTNKAGLQGVGFKVYAYNTGTVAMADVVDASGMKAFLNETATYNSGWTLSGGSHYWPLNSKIQFFAYGNPGAGTLVYNAPADTKKYPSITYTVADVSSQTDLVVAAVPNANQTDNATVIFNFSHALSQINFTFKGEAGLSYKVKSFAISGVNSKGEYDFGTSKWTSQATLATYTNSTVMDITTETPVNVAWMLMPQTLPADSKITITYDVYNGTDLIAEVPSVDLALKDTQVWEAGKKIRYTLTLTAKGAEITLGDAEVGSWAEGDDSNVTKP